MSWSIAVQFGTASSPLGRNRKRSRARSQIQNSNYNYETGSILGQLKKVNRKVQEEPHSEATANPWH